MLTCRELFDFLTEYAEGTLPAEQKARFEEHLGVCSQCEEFLETYRKTVELTAESWCSDTEDVPEQVPEALVQAILDARRGDAE